MENNKKEVKYSLNNIFFIYDGESWQPYIPNMAKNRIKNVLTNNILETSDGMPVVDCERISRTWAYDFDGSALRKHFNEFTGNDKCRSCSVSSAFKWISNDNEFVANILFGGIYRKWQSFENKYHSGIYNQTSEGYLDKTEVGVSYIKKITGCLNSLQERQGRIEKAKQDKELSETDRRVKLNQEGRDF